MNIPEIYQGYRAKYIHNFDGDTCTLLIDLGMNTFSEQSIRLKDVWCEEISTRSNKAIHAKNYLCNLLMDADEIRVKTFKNKNNKDIKSFERYIGVIWIKGNNSEWECVNDELVNCNLATKERVEK